MSCMTIGKVVTNGGGEEPENWFFNFYFFEPRYLTKYIFPNHEIVHTYKEHLDGGNRVSDI